MEKNNEVERARAWFDKLTADGARLLRNQIFGSPDKFQWTDENILIAYKFKHPESKEPQREAERGCPFDEEAFNPDTREAERTYSIEEAANDLIRETFGNFTECQQQILVSYVDLLDFAKEAAKLSKINSKTANESPSESVEQLKARVEELKKELKVTNQLLDERNYTLSLIPECPLHGNGCQPHYRDWIRERK